MLSAGVASYLDIKEENKKLNEIVNKYEANDNWQDSFGKVWNQIARTQAKEKNMIDKIHFRALEMKRKNITLYIQDALKTDNKDEILKILGIE